MFDANFFGTISLQRDIEEVTGDKTTVLLFRPERADEPFYSSNAKMEFVYRDGKMIAERNGGSNFRIGTKVEIMKKVFDTYVDTYGIGDLEISLERIYLKELSMIKKQNLYCTYYVLAGKTIEAAKKAREILFRLDAEAIENDAVARFEKAVKIFTELAEEGGVGINKPHLNSWKDTVVYGSGVKKLWTIYSNI